MDIDSEVPRFRDDSDDYYYQMEESIFEMATRDDKDGLVNLVRDQEDSVEDINSIPKEETNSNWYKRLMERRFIQKKKILDEVILEVIKKGAVNSAKALLCGEAGSIFELNVPLSCGTFLLHHAASYYSVTLIELLLRHGARTDVRTNGADLKNNGMLPLNVALENLRYHNYPVDWTSKDSILKLIRILCLPQLKVALEATRLLAQHTKETKEEFYLYAKDGYPIQMAILLMVARDIVLAPFPSQSDDGSNLDGIMSIRKCIEKEIASLDVEVVNINGKGRNSEPVRILKDKKAGLHSALLLLHVFEKVGDSIDAYLQSKPSDTLSKDKVVEDVKSILVEAGFNLKKKDTNLSNIEWETYDGWSSNGDLECKDLRSTISISSQPLGHPLPSQVLHGKVPVPAKVKYLKPVIGIALGL